MKELILEKINSVQLKLPVNAQKEVKKGDRLICPVCGKEFIAASKKHKCCSISCNKAYYYKNVVKKDVKKPVKICPICGKEFTANRKDKEYCSPACVAKAHYEKRKGKAKLPYREIVKGAVMTCPVCGKKFTTTCVTNKGYCSPACYAKAKYRTAANRPLSDREFYKTLTKTCPICGKEFVSRSKQQICCSSECRTEYRKGYKKQAEAPVSLKKTFKRSKMSKLFRFLSRLV